MEENKLNIIVKDEDGNVILEQKEGETGTIEKQWKRKIVCTDFSYRHRKRGHYRTRRVINEERRARHPEWGGSRNNSGRKRKWDEKTEPLSMSVPSSTRARFFKIKETGMDITTEIVELIDGIANALGID